MPPRPRKEQIKQVLDVSINSNHASEAASDFHDYRASNEQLNQSSQFVNHDYEEGSLQREQQQHAASSQPKKPQQQQQVQFKEPNETDGRVFKLVVNQPKTTEHARLIVPFVDEKKRPKSADIYNLAKPEPKPRNTAKIVRKEAKTTPKKENRPKLPERSPVTSAKKEKRKEKSSKPQKQAPPPSTATISPKKPKWKEPPLITARSPKKGRLL